MSRIGFIGIGVMGAFMAPRLRDSAEELAVFDVRPEALEPLAALGATICGSPAEVAAGTDTVFLSLPTPEIVSAVVTGPRGVLDGERPGAVVDLSTTGPTTTRAVARACSEAGVDFLDAPVSGGPNGARDGTLTVMAAGPAELFGACKPYLERIGANVLHVGEEPGQGQLTKLLNNLLSATAIAITSEAVALGVKGGLEPEVLLGAINVSSGRNTASADKFPRCVLPRTFDFGFRLRLMEKDVNLCLDAAANLRAPMPLASMVRQMWSLAAAELPEDADSTAIAQMVERWAGVTIGEAAGA